MMTTLRQIVTTFLILLLFVFLIGTINFIVFPLESLMELFTRKLFNIPFIAFILLVIFLFSAILGITNTQYWKQRFEAISRYLSKLNHSETLTFTEKYPEITPFEAELKALDNKLQHQVEQIQHLATERAKEREQSLQEVVMQERNRLARDLHDSVSQHLFAASMMMSAIHETVSNENQLLKQQAHQVEKMIHQAQLEMRALLLHLRPVALKGKPLQQGIEDLLMELSSRLPIEITWKTEEFPIEKGVEDELFRIVQEALSNALRHAEADHIHVMLIQRDHLIILRIVDDGKGFNLDEVITTSYGLENMKERAHDLGGTCKIISLPQQGTRIEVQVPIVKKGE